jgi:tetratricopeptide (TPR) repeat protein
MDWCYDEEDPRYIDLLELIGIPLGLLRYLEDRISKGQKAANLCRKLGKQSNADWYEVRDVAWSLVRMGTNEAREQGRKILEDNYERAAERGDSRTLALTLRNLGRLAMDDDDFETAQSYLERSLSIWAEMDHSFWKYITMHAMADLMRKQARYDEATDLYKTLEKEATRVGDIDGIVETRISLALIRAELNDCKESIQMSKASISLAGSINPPAIPLGYALLQSSKIKKLCGDIEGAISDAEESEKIYKALGIIFQVDKLRSWIEKLKYPQSYNSS